MRRLCGMNYEQMSDGGLHISFGPDRKRPQLLAVDNVVLCAGQQPVPYLEAELRTSAPTCATSAAGPLPTSWTPSAPSTGHRTGSKAVSWFGISLHVTGANESLTCKESHP